MPWQVISPGEPLVVNMEIENLLTEPININLGQGQSSGVQATVILPTGLSIPVQRVPSDRNKCCGMYFGPVPIVTLEGRQVLKQQILFDGWYRAPIYDKYTVQSNLLNPNVRSASGRLVQLAPGRPVEFTVTPRNVPHFATGGMHSRG